MITGICVFVTAVVFFYIGHWITARLRNQPTVLEDIKRDKIHQEGSDLMIIDQLWDPNPDDRQYDA